LAILPKPLYRRSKIQSFCLNFKSKSFFYHHVSIDTYVKCADTENVTEKETETENTEHTKTKVVNREINHKLG
jgi:hypothetical protein